MENPVGAYDETRMKMKTTADPKSLNDFMTTVQEGMDYHCAQHGIDSKTNEGAGYAFSVWVADLFMRGDERLRCDFDDAVNRGGSDLGVDIVLRDDGARQLVLVQTKFQGTGRKTKPLDADALAAFCTQHERLLSDKFRERGNAQAKALLGEYSDLFKEGCDPTPFTESGRQVLNWRLSYQQGGSHGKETVHGGANYPEAPRGGGSVVEGPERRSSL
jgi:hypothetical protein